MSKTPDSGLRCNQLLYGSLFSGIGGIDLGFDRAGLKCAWQVEINPFARRVLQKHWPEVPKHDDITTFNGNEWPWVDVIAGGFPCQDISYAGKGAGLQGERSGLFYEAMRIVREMGPRYVVLENVSALLVRGLDQVLGTLASIGYDAEWECLPAAAFGAPHGRDRVFVLGCNANRNNVSAVGGSSGQRKKAATDGDLQREDSDVLPFRDSTRPGWRGHWEHEPAVGRVADGIPNRMDRLRGVGNAVVPQVAEWIGRRLIESV
jgi:DNA (cytosine-5)-methyltransferase 1